MANGLTALCGDDTPTVYHLVSPRMICFPLTLAVS